MKSWQLWGLLIVMVLLWGGLNAYMFLVSDTSGSYSLYQRFEEYKGVYNWNLPVYADGLFDSDQEIDLVFSNGCVYLSRHKIKDELHETNCEPVYPGFRDRLDGEKIEGVKVIGSVSEDAGSFKVAHSFVAKKKNENWKIYEQVNGGVRVFEILPNGEVVKIEPSFGDRVDALWYFLGNGFSVFI